MSTLMRSSQTWVYSSVLFSISYLINALESDNKQEQTKDRERERNREGKGKTEIPFGLSGHSGVESWSFKVDD